MRLPRRRTFWVSAALLLVCSDGSMSDPEVLENFREGSKVGTKSVEEIEKKGLRSVRWLLWALPGEEV